MKKKQQTTNLRRQDLQRFIAARKIKVARWAKEAGISEGTIRNFLTKRSETLTQATVDALAAAMGIATSVIFPSVEKAEKGRSPNLTFMAKSQADFGAKDLPVAATVKISGGMRIDRARVSKLTERPVYLRKIMTAYALSIHDETMSPAFEGGWLVYVDPTETAKVGDNVVAEMTDGRAVIRRLVKKSKTGVTLRQFNPKKDTQVKADKLASLHCIAGVRYRR
ncbi:MAG: helix-turn-helix domain-containing protein [Proteobacteria bacterium]|nr:helix-turn-helix domain-containing protein [Pseudomonadota bacterium]